MFRLMQLGVLDTKGVLEIKLVKYPKGAPGPQHYLPKFAVHNLNIWQYTQKERF